MALIQQTMTEKNLEAHRKNARQSHGAATPEGKERARAANLRHGYYSQLRDEALAALGEDPEALAALVEGARQQFRPANVYQEWIADRLARLQWRIDRAERMQESRALTHLRQVEAKRREKARQLRDRCADLKDFLGELRRAVARPDFHAPNQCLERCREVMVQNPSPNLEYLLDLLHQLRRPRRFTTPAPPPLPEAMSDEEWQEVLREEAAGECSVPDDEIKVAQGQKRDPLREELWNLAAEELRRATEALQKDIAAQEAPLSLRARDFYVTQISGDLELHRREERACFREFWRLGNDLKKLQTPLQVPGQKASVEDGHQPSRVQASGSEVATEEIENQGASGYVEENTGRLEDPEMTKGPLGTSPREPQPASSDDLLSGMDPVPTPLASAFDNPPPGQ